MLKSVIFVMIAIVAVPALSLPVAKLRIDSKNIQAAKEGLEAKLGSSLSADQRREIAVFIKEQNAVMEVSNRAPKKKMKCFGGNVATIGQLARGACVHVHFFDGYGFEPTLRFYEYAMLGAGINFSLMLQSFNAYVTYDSTRYDKDFDPIPGEYGTLSLGGALGIGWSVLGGSSGNKLIEAFIWNVGGSVDLSTVSLMVIR